MKMSSLGFVCYEFPIANALAAIIPTLRFISPLQNSLSRSSDEHFINDIVICKGGDRDSETFYAVLQCRKPGKSRTSGKNKLKKTCAEFIYLI